MSHNVTSIDQRRAHRRPADVTTVVNDVISGRVLGQLGNLSTGGLLLIATQPPRHDAVYQVSLALPGRNESLELGIQEQWQDATPRAGRTWAGFRIIAIDEDDAIRLKAWVGEGQALDTSKT